MDRAAKRLADEAAQSLQGVLEEAGISDDVLRDVVDRVQQRGRGGRTPASDPRLDPSIEPKKAKRILANRLSAAKSKMRQRVLSESLDILKSQNPSSGMGDDDAQEELAEELHQVKRLCTDLQAKNRGLEGRLRVLEAQAAISTAALLQGPPLPQHYGRLPGTSAHAGNAGPVRALPASALAPHHQLPPTLGGYSAAALYAAALAGCGGGGGMGLPGGSWAANASPFGMPGEGGHGARRSGGGGSSGGGAGPRAGSGGGSAFSSYVNPASRNSSGGGGAGSRHSSPCLAAVGGSGETAMTSGAREYSPSPPAPAAPGGGAF